VQEYTRDYHAKHSAIYGPLAAVTYSSEDGLGREKKQKN